MAFRAASPEGMVRRQSGGAFEPPSPEYVAFTNAPQILGITGTFFAIAMLSVLLKCYVRVAMMNFSGLDDYAMIMAMSFATATFACFIVETKLGLGKHLTVMLMNAADYVEFTKVLYVHSLLIMIGVSWVKISIAFSLIRLSPRKTYTRFLYGMIVFMVVMTLGCAGSLIFQCLPVQAAWDMSLRPPPLGTGTAKCYSNITFRNIGLMNSAFNIVTDALFATLPIPLIWRLQINARTKISLIVVLSLGWFACAAAIIKAVQQWRIFEDLDWTVHDSFNVWNFLELTIGIIAASLPSLKPLFNWFLKTARTVTSGGKSRGPSGATSLGYHNMRDVSTGGDIALQSFPTRGAGSPTEELALQYGVSVSQNWNGRDKNRWRVDQAKTSDESILPLHQHPEPGQNNILMTKEVRIT